MAVFHRHTLNVALSGLTAIVIYKLAFTGFATGAGLAGFAGHMLHEWVTLTNLLALLLGFALFSNRFEWRVCFKWEAGHAWSAEIVDYH